MNMKTKLSEEVLFEWMKEVMDGKGKLAFDYFSQEGTLITSVYISLVTASHMTLPECKGG